MRKLEFVSCIEKEGLKNMQVNQTPLNIRAIQSSWVKFDSMVHLRPISDEAGYSQMTSLMNALLDVVGDDEDHAMSGLLDLVEDLVSRYERENYAIGAAQPKDSSRFLIEARGPKQVDQCDIVPQSNRIEVVRLYDLAVSSDSSIETPHEEKIGSLHDRDFYSWAKEQAALLKNGQANLLDYKNLAEELEDMGTSQESALETAIKEALLHLLKLKYSPAEDPRNSWLISVSKQRTQIESVLRKNPGLKSKLDQIFNDAWEDARKLTIFAYRVYNEHPNIPANSPFSLGDVRNEDFFPSFEQSSD